MTIPISIPRKSIRKVKTWILKVAFCGFVCLVWSSSTTRLYRRRAPRQSVSQFYVLPQRQSWETMTSVSASHIILTPTQSVGSGRPQRELDPGPPHQESHALPTELPRSPLNVAESNTEKQWRKTRKVFLLLLPFFVPNKKCSELKILISSGDREGNLLSLWHFVQSKSKAQQSPHFKPIPKHKRHWDKERCIPISTSCILRPPGTPRPPPPREGLNWRCSTSCLPTVCTKKSRMVSPREFGLETRSV